MGFRKGSYAKVWEIKPISDTMTKLRISISRKDKRTDEYVQDFGDYVACVGTMSASKASKLHEGDRIHLGDVDVCNRYDKEKRVTYTNFKIFSFETEAEMDSGDNSFSQEPMNPVDNGEPEDDSLLPF